MKLEIEELKEEEGYTVRLLNKSMPKSEQVIFGLLLFDGNTYSWLVRFMSRKKVTVFLDSRKEFKEVRQILIQKVQDYLRMGYKLTKKASGYDVTPW